MSNMLKDLLVAGMRIHLKDMVIELTPEEFMLIYRALEIHETALPRKMFNSIPKKKDRRGRNTRKISLEQIKFIKELQLDHPKMKSGELTKLIKQYKPSWKITRNQVRYWMLNTPPELQMKI